MDPTTTSETTSALSTSPNPTCFYQTAHIRHSLAKIRRAIARKQGLCCIFGDVGLGKSSLLRFLFAEYASDDNFQVAFLPSGDLPSSYAFTKRIASEFGLPAARSRLAQMDAIEEYLMEKHGAGRTVVILIDEAQLLSLDYLEVIRSLLNFETSSEKMCQFVLSGQLDLRDRLEQKRYRAFRSRIVAPVLMQPLTAEETEAMIAHRLEVWGAPNPFTSAAAQRVHELAGGVPRQILLVCQHSLDVADGAVNIGPEIIDRGFTELSMRESQVAQGGA